jgi:hypothetical protein
MVEHRETEKKKLFVEAYAEAVQNGVPQKEALRLAKAEAGYHENYSINIILRGLGPEWVEYAQRELNLTIPTAIKGIVDVLNLPDEKGSANKLAAAASLLDRAGIGKKETRELNVTMPSGIAFMPQKVPVNLDDAVTEE